MNDNEIKLIYSSYQRALQRKSEEEYPEPMDENIIASYEALQKALKTKAETFAKLDISESRLAILEGKEPIWKL